ncbi:type II secretion system F family protein [Phenylobacterium sp.]|uniref:type II secretion system F family protein n=1 Tax=Phenylobacterium sp. TaxID=1871053 RepID=UPI002FDF3977
MTAPPLLILMMLGTAALVATALLDFGQAGSRRLVKRARALGAGSGQAQRKAERALRQRSETRLDGIVRRLLPRPAALRLRLESTGLPITFTHYAVACVAVMLVGAALAAAVGAPPFLALLEGIASGVWLPHVAVGLLMARRRNRFFRHFPEAIGLIVRGLRAGLPVTETIGVVGREIADPVGAEFRRIADQVRLGQPMEDAMWQTARRLGLPEFNFLVISLSVQRETGGNLAETLENLETILRRRQQMRLKIRAMASEATASALIIGALPFVMAVLMYLASRDYMMLLVTEPLGRLMMGAGVASMAVGGFVMRKMTQFEI